MAMITLMEYAKRHDKNVRYLRTKCANDGFKTGQKIGRDWFIDEDEPCLDNRVTDGKWVGYVRPENRGKTPKQNNSYCIRYKMTQSGDDKEIRINAKTRQDAYDKAVHEEIPKIEGQLPICASVYSVTYKNGNTRLLNQNEGLDKPL